MNNNFLNKKVAVLGFGIEGESIIRFLLEYGASVSVFDQKGEKEFDKEKLEHFKKKGVKFTFHTIPPLTQFDLIVRSPGVSLMKYEIEKAKEAGILITSPTKIFFDLCPCPIIGVTGTKGKGTTSTLIYEMLKKANFEAFLGGNIGPPPLDFVKNLKPSSWVVLELSSFQLQDLTKSPHIAIFLMVTSEHLDYHKDTQEYVDAKRNILRFQSKNDFAIINRDYPASNESNIYTNGKVYLVSRQRDSFEGCFVENGKIVVLMKRGVGMAARMDQRHRQTSNQNDTDSDTETIKQQTIIDTKEILIPGKHNWENVCAAVMAAILAGVLKKQIVDVLKTFKGLEHRLELVATINGVRYYDDSFSTTPETAQAAIEAFDVPEILILGGSSKNSDFSALGKLIDKKQNIKAIIGIGVEWERIKLKIKNEKLKIIEDKKNMKEIVESAAQVAELGNVVLLSPACASFDMFKNYKDRGKQFKDEVLKLKENSTQ